MSIVAKLKELETAIKDYAETAGKDISDVFTEVLDFVEGKKAEATASSSAGSSSGASTPPKTAA